MKTSRPIRNPAFSKMGATISSETPGLTVDSRITRAPFLRLSATTLAAPTTGARSGLCNSSTGVGTQMSTMSALLRSFGSDAARKGYRGSISERYRSSMGLFPALIRAFFDSSRSKPRTSYPFSLARTASGSPTYPSPTTPTVSFFVAFFEAVIVK